jgi:hypothetical protein
MPKKEVAEPETVTIPAVNVDRGMNGKGEPIVEILCTPQSIRIKTEDVKDKDGNVIDTKIVGGDVTFVDTDGGEHTANFKGKTPIYRLFQKIGAYERAVDLIALDGRKRSKYLRDAFAEHDPIIARVTENGDLFCTVTQRWKKNDIENILPVINDHFEGFDINVTPSDGRYGGKAEIPLGGDESFTPRVVISMGPKDGQHSVKILTAGVVIYCENQLTADVRHAVRGLIPKTSSFYLTQKHSTRILDESVIAGALMDAKAAASELIEVLAQARERKLKAADVMNILRYYNSERVISARTAADILQLYGDAEVSQVPGTYYGLIMAVTNHGTHTPELKDGVRTNLGNMGGEMTVLAGDEAYHNFHNLVEGRCSELEKDIFAEPEKASA